MVNENDDESLIRTSIYNANFIGKITKDNYIKIPIRIADAWRLKSGLLIECDIRAKYLPKYDSDYPTKD